ncbi:hypothetical protein HLB23_09185 [Nocardia uniformis]|uniref:AbiEi antitoxin N-terminal domain-containing protein n=1 Tax=Nocardia uniformis TaxID=53432 RepID=A0A849BV15_9NOCA|nr:type IV toxin-antitoxin system AbiEi family antitoxin domain-containing protein [Nocardia uniformis]NNH70034.1 hypothetical protein [Nocardia uniformis]
MSSDSRASELIGVAAEQWGLITSRQARAVVGATPQLLKRMADTGVLERVHHGLYRLARFPHDEHLDKRVAWVALDPSRLAWERLDDEVPAGVLSHRTAANVHRVGDMDADVVELTATRRIRISVPDVTIHRGGLTRTDWQVVDGMPVTTAVRTIRDLAAVPTDAGHLASVVRDVLVRSLASTDDVVEALTDYAFGYGHRALDGQGFLDALIEQAGVPATTRDLAERANRAERRNRE